MSDSESWPNASLGSLAGRLKSTEWERFRLHGLHAVARLVLPCNIQLPSNMMKQSTAHRRSIEDS